MTQDRPWFAYSLRWSLYFGVILGTLGVIWAVYLGLTEYGWRAILTTPGLFFLVAVWGLYDYSRKPLREARFFLDHFELSGRDVIIMTDYGSITSLKLTKQHTGRSKQAVLFTVKDYPFGFRIPFRREKGKPNLFAELAEKTSKNDSARSTAP